MSVVYKSTAEKFQMNSIAAGYNNVSGLRNIETVYINGNQIAPIRDLGNYEGGLRVRNGVGVVKETGYASHRWNAGYLSNAQRWWLQTEILAGAISGPITFKALKYGVSMADSMTAPYIIANAILTLPPGRSNQTYVDGITGFDYDLSRLVIIEEDQMYGSIYVSGGSTAQENIGTTPVLLTAFAANGINNGVTPDHSSDNLTALIAGKYKPQVTLSFTATLSTKWTFTIYKNGATTGIIGIVETDDVPSAVNIAFGMGRFETVSANDIYTVYVNSDDGGATADITVTDGAFSLESVAL
jgi:hypothetical protein